MFNLPLDKNAAKLHTMTLDNGVRKCGRTVKYQSYKFNTKCIVQNDNFNKIYYTRQHNFATIDGVALSSILE